MEVAFEGVSKAFPGVQAVDDVSFAVLPGSIHALVGENGAGKSTLLKVLAGVCQPDGGRVLLDGQPTSLPSPASALDAGIAIIYQELHLVPHATVAENVLLGHLPQRGGFVRGADRDQTVRGILDELGIDVSPRTPVAHLSIALRQMVEIAKALSRNARVFAFDEPTSSLSGTEVTTLFRVIRGLRDRGCAVLYVSHRLGEIFDLCDAATVLRDGRRVATHSALDGVDANALIEQMVGRRIEDVFGYRPRPLGAPVLAAEGVQAHGLTAPVDLEVRSGEIVGVFGLVGSGRTELLRALGGASRLTAGAVAVGGEAVTLRSPRDAIRAGVVLCPEDRKAEGFVGVRSVRENLNLAARNARHTPWIQPQPERAFARQAADRFDIRSGGLDVRMDVLSGGNQQKVVLARWHGTALRVALLDEPTRGIDVGAKKEIYDTVHDLATQGAGALLVSSEMPELLGVCDRILVMRQGALVAEFTREDATQQALLEAALPAPVTR